MTDVLTTDRFEKRRKAAAYARLVERFNAGVEAIEADPWGAIDEAADEIVRLRRALQTLSYVLCPPPSWEEGPVRGIDIEAELLERHDKAIAVLREAGF